MRMRIKRILMVAMVVIMLVGLVQVVNADQLQDECDLFIMSSNVLFNDTYDTEYRMHCLAETYLNYMPDILCLQEAKANQTNALYPLLDEYYAAVPLEQHATDSQQIVYQQILYRKEMFTVLDSGFTRFREDVFPWGVSWTVFQRISDGKQFCVMSTHLSIISSTYDPGASNTVEGVQLRINDCNTILATVEAVRNKYLDIPILVGGDWNEICGSPSLEPVDNSELLTNAMKVASVANTAVNTTHDLCRMPVKGGDIIDHFYVTTDTLEVKEQNLVVDGIVIQGSDHCPIYVQVSFK
ncbi:MAG: endonuclease/exonuclease/phosphatase family protein [Roseburia sp.]|nr:endonuclease/exonuclease/phosphatase family protein [Roseburia sp.]